MRRVTGRQTGFTLIECLACLGILGLGLVAVSGALTAALLSHQKASNIEQAAGVAQDVIEEMRSRGFGSITYDSFPATASVPGLHSGMRSVYIENAYSSDPRLKRVAITVNWRGANGSAERVRLETIIGNRGGHAKG